MGLFKKSKIKLAMDLQDVIKKDSDNLFECIKDDKEIYSHCESDAKVSFYTFILVTIIYKDKLSREYNEVDVFKVIYTCLTSSYNQIGEKSIKVLTESTKQINTIIEYDRKNGIDDMINALVIFLLAMSVGDKEFLEKEIDGLLRKSNCYFKLHKCIEKIFSSTPLDFDNYRIRRK